MCEHPLLGVVPRDKLGRCRLCHREAERRWRARNPDKIAEARKRLSPRQANYARTRRGVRFSPGISKETLLEKQQNNCGICRKPLDFSNPFRVHVDHDHSIKSESNVRGVLCRDCNQLLGCAGDSIEVLEKAIIYLKRGVWKE